MSLHDPSNLYNPGDVDRDQIIDELTAIIGFLAFQLHLVREHPNGEGIDDCGGYVAEIALEGLELFDDHFEQTIAKQDNSFIISGQLRQPESGGNA